MERKKIDIVIRIRHKKVFGHSIDVLGFGLPLVDNFMITSGDKPVSVTVMVEVSSRFQPTKQSVHLH